MSSEIKSDEPDPSAAATLELKTNGEVTPAEQAGADDEAILTAMNEAAKEVADAAAEAIDGETKVDKPSDDNGATSATVEPKPAQAPADVAVESQPTDTSASQKDAKPEAADAKLGEEVHAKDKPKKETKKRIRRVGRTTPRKLAKLEGAPSDVLPDTPMGIPPTNSEIPAPPTAGAAPVGGTEGVAPAAAAMPESIPRVLSKHDEKWNGMFEKLVAFKAEQNSTLVPQCYDQDPRLGRWVHYQRVEYWIYQQSGVGKITPDRIARLEAMGFEWDPQRAQWNQMFEKLLKFKEEIGHCKVPKGYTKDPELANWVRNQRLEHANMVKGKKSRMTEDRYKKLDEAGFKWSNTMPAKSPKAAPAPKDAREAGETTNDKATPNNEPPKDAGEVKVAEKSVEHEETSPKVEGEPSKEMATNEVRSPEAGAGPETVEV